MNPMMFGRRIALDQVTRRNSLLFSGLCFGVEIRKAENVLLYSSLMSGEVALDNRIVGPTQKGDKSAKSHQRAPTF